jgi:hypothetical protein
MQSAQPRAFPFGHPLCRTVRSVVHTNAERKALLMSGVAFSFRKENWCTDHRSPRAAHHARHTEHASPRAIVHSTPRITHHAESTEHRAQSTEHRAQSTEHRAQSTEHSTPRTPLSSPNFIAAKAATYSHYAPPSLLSAHTFLYGDALRSCQHKAHHTDTRSHLHSRVETSRAFLCGKKRAVLSTSPKGRRR